MLIPALLLLLASPAPPDLALYLPFDGETAPVLGALPLEGVTGAPAHGPGLRGEAADLSSDCRLRLGQPFPQEAGTAAFWLRPHWPATDTATHDLLCIYGDSRLADNWARNRFSLVDGGGRLTFSVFGGEPGQQWDLAAEVTLADGSWHHIAVTWEGINRGAGAAALGLYVDGRLAAARTEQTIAVGPSAALLDLGRDSDGSPDYAQAWMDDLFLYSRALTPDEIGSGVLRVTTEGGAATAPAAPARTVPGWQYSDRAYRVALTLPVPEQPVENAVAQARLALSQQLRDLGVPGRPDATSLRLVDAETGQEIAARYESPVLEWAAGAPGAAPRHFDLYLATREYEYLAPLVVAGPPSAGSAAPAVGTPAGDYAQSAYGDAWDFDEGDTEEIDSFGDKPSYIQNVHVADGALMARVLEDPYIIWGTMWGPEDQGHRKVRIDVSRNNLLEMRVRQSVDAATWRIIGRSAGSDQLLQCEFTVSGTDWQTIRIDLRRQARWNGTLSALRIDPTEKVEADIAIDYVRLVPAVECVVGSLETLGSPSGEPTGVALTVSEPQAVAGSRQEVTARVLDAAGQGVAGQPVVIRLAAGSAGRLEPSEQPSLALPDGGLRGLTGSDGALRVRLTAGARVAGASASVLASAEFPTLEAAPVAIATVPGPPDHYEVLSPGVTIVHEEETPLALEAFVADACGNRLPVAGRRLTWSVDDATLADARAVTDAQGAANARLTPDTAKRWVYRVGVKDDQGLSGLSGEICVLPKGPRADPPRLGPNGYFATGAVAFVPLGGFYAVWVPRIAEAGQEEGRALGPFTAATEEEMHHWFAFLRDQGVTAMRFMLRTHGPDGTEALDAGGRVNRKLFARILRLMDIARQYDLRFLLTLHDDYDKPVYCNERHLANFSLPAFADVDLDTLPAFQRRFLRDRKLLSPPQRYTDPDAIACQDQYTREVVGYLKDNPALFGWELENEMVSCPTAWVNHQVEVIRAEDPVTPICVSHGGGGLATADPLWWTTRSNVDFYTYHLYPLGTTTPEVDFGAGVDLLTRYGRMAGTCFLGESVGDEFNDYPADGVADRRAMARDIIWLSLVNGNPGCFFWNARGYEVEEFRLAREVTDGIDWTRWQWRRPPIAVLVPHPLEDDRYYQTAQGQADWAMMGRYCQHFLSTGQDFDFALTADGYAATCDLARFAPPATTGQPFGAPPGFQLASLTHESGLQGLVYIRNFAGVRAWEVGPGRPIYLRARAAAPLRVQLGLGERALTAHVWDLTTGEARTVELTGGGSLDLGTSDHDFAIRWEAGG